MRWFDNLRIEVRIAFAVCAGMLSYKFIITLAWASWYYGWLGHWQQDQMLIAAFWLTIVACASAWLWRSRRVAARR